MKKIDSINIIPFIDVVLVLLVIVLLTTTFMTKLEIELPKGGNSEEKPQKAIYISITKSGEIFFDEERVYDLENRLMEIPKNSNLFVKADKESNFEHFVKLIDTLKKLNYESISIATQK